MLVIDLKSQINFGRKTFSDSLKGLASVQWTNSLLTTNRLLTKTAFRQMRSTISRQPSDKIFFLFRPVSLHGICPSNISSESARYRDLPAGNPIQTVSLRHTREYFQNHSGKGKRKSRLENICRPRAYFNKQSPNTLRQRRLWHSTEPRGLCSGFNNHRFMSVSVPMGEISQTQSSYQGTYADELKRLHTHVYPHYRRESPRCKYPRQSRFRTWRHLRYGSRIPRLRSPLYFHSKPFNFCHESQKQFRLPPSLLSQGRQNNRASMRPDDNAQRLLCIAGLSRCPSSNWLLRYQDEQEVYLSNKQLHSVGLDNCSTLQVPLADRNLLQMDQAIPSNQDVLRHQYQRCEDSNLDSYQHLRSGRNRQERTQNRAEFGRNLANSQHCAFRESLYHTSTYENYVAKRKYSVS